MENMVRNQSKRQNNQSITASRASIALLWSIWVISYTFLFNWAFQVFIVIALLFATLELIGIVGVFFSKSRINSVAITLILMLLMILISTLKHFSDMRFGYFLYEIGPLITLLYYILKKNHIGIRSKNDISIIYFTIMSLAAICSIFFSRGDYSDRAHIIIFPNLVLNSNIFSYPLVLGVVIGIERLIREHRTGYKILYLFALCCILYVIIECRSRGAYLTLIASIFIMFLVLATYGNSKVKRHSRRISFVCIAVLIPVLIYVLINNNIASGLFSDSGRFDLWKIAINRWVQSPLFGSGNSENYSAFLTCHNWFLDILSQFGIFTLFFYILFYILLVRKLLSSKNKSPMVCLLVFSLIQSLIDCGSMTQIIVLIIAIIQFDLISEHKKLLDTDSHKKYTINSKSLKLENE